MAVNFFPDHTISGEIVILCLCWKKMSPWLFMLLTEIFIDRMR